ncbi:class I SAM-dependent methyltransferase [Pseudomarimonas salicorniae]|uniref:Class I SAM-dependent methyltransferase n=1 Tax=Pseudomarimonas salicorniae TaxID=2933270 RepID=A0ABT0GL15_9GAMM|nr:class I SAM-dependent methyltransferase [Lysobacter sp. CAU 1642]
MNIVEHNRKAWNRESREGSEWCRPVGPEVIAAARKGTWSVILTPNKPVPAEWLGDVAGRRILCLASGGGQQAPILAAAGALVTSFDLSEEQLAKDRAVALRDELQVVCVQGDMADLSAFPAGSFDMVFHPVSNVFVPDVAVVWRECYRVLHEGGELLAGFMNPSLFLFDHDEAEKTGSLVVRHALPYREPESLGEAAAALWRESGRPAEFSHSLEAQIGGQLAAGFMLAGLYEDGWTDAATPLDRWSPLAIATRALKRAQ